MHYCITYVLRRQVRTRQKQWLNRRKATQTTNFIYFFAVYGTAPSILEILQCPVARQVNNEMAREKEDRDPAEGTIPTSIWIKGNQEISVRTVS